VQDPRATEDGQRSPRSLRQGRGGIGLGPSQALAAGSVLIDR